MAIIFRRVFSEDGKFYPQLFLDDPLYDVQKCNTKELLMMQELIIIKIHILQDFVIFVSFGFLGIKTIIMKIMHAMGVIIY